MVPGEYKKVHTPPIMEESREVLSLNDKKLQEAIGWSPFGEQKQIIEAFDTHRDIRLAAGVRLGKSMLCGYLALREFLKDDKHIWIVAPSYELSEKIFQYIVKWVGTGFPKLAGGISNRPIPQIISPWGSWIRCKSAENPTGLLGEELDLAIIDEASRIKKDVWEGYVYDRLTSRQGKSIFISTPFGQNWFWEEWVKAKTAEDGASFQFESRVNPYFPPGEWQRAKERLREDLFNQNYRAQFLRGAASFFRGVRECISGEVQAAKKGHFYTIGIDWAKHRDYTVAIVIDRMNNHVVAMDRFHRIDYPLQERRIVELAKKYNHPQIWMDTTGVGEPISDSLKRTGLSIRDFKFTGKSKESLMEKLAIMIEKKKVFYPDIEILVDELESFGIEFSKAGNMKYSAPEGMHDDCVDALALACWALADNPLKAGEIEPIIFNTPTV
ncbi:MAG TPA: hypothetical protein ENI13_00515 [candidate division CPR3 bacterium]|uniref:Terminase large subunit gp17-like C-terminal domain-containing protein n=1 Tax=candidate division CPR3 bacterium TaxID=2268181 RepID=A0A7C1NXM2_UNCC3|nr:hypothetical protein [candidate division CPR3 bacterium]